MLPAEVVGTAHQVHPRRQASPRSGRSPGRDAPAGTDAARNVALSRSMYAVLIPVPVPVAGSTAGDRLGRPPHHPPGDAHEATAAVVLDHLAQQQPGDRPPAAAGPAGRCAPGRGRPGRRRSRSWPGHRRRPGSPGSAPHERTIRTTAVIRVRSRRGLTTPPSQSRDGTAIAMAIQSRRPTALTYNSSAWTCPSSTCPRRTRCSWRRWPCRPARSRQAATVRSSRPKAATMAWSGQPWQSRVMHDGDQVRRAS